MLLNGVTKIFLRQTEERHSQRARASGSSLDKHVEIRREPHAPHRNWIVRAITTTGCARNTHGRFQDLGAKTKKD